jgi:hypothetical protein
MPDKANKKPPAKIYTRPTEIDLANVPQELRDTPQWECWKMWGGLKVPIDVRTEKSYPRGLYKSDQMGNATFEQACALLARRKDLLGVGFRFKSFDPYTGIDLDDVRDPATGELQLWAWDFVSQFATYSEVSPSGTGLHIVGRAKIPEALIKTALYSGHVEIYSDGRYFTITGKKLPDAPSKISEIQTQTNYWYGILSDTPAKNGDRPAANADGNVPDYLTVKGRTPEGSENVEASDVTGPPGIPLPAGVDFGALLTERGLKFAKYEGTDGISYDYHGLEGQPCLIQGTVHAAQARNVRQSRFVVRDGRVFHQCFDSDCRGETGGKTRRALKKLGIEFGARIGTANFGTANFGTDEVENAATIITVPYPVDAWAGTLYGEYAELQTAGNFIPPEFFIESVKTVVGAIAGDRVSGNRDGANLRQFTVIVGVVGKGKGTAARHTTNEFRGSPQRPDGASTDYIRAETTVSAYRQIGAVLANSASEVGLYRSAKACPRILLTPTEFSEFLAKMKIENSALSSNVRELFDTTWFTPTTSAKREAKELPTRCMLSLLSTTQLSTLTTALATHGGLGEGLVSRLTFVYHDECRTVAALEEADLEDWRRRLFAKLLTIETGGQAFVFDTGAVKLLNEWWQAIQTGGEENEEIITRLNVITLRNALHFSWLRTEPDEPLSWRVDVEDMEKAIRLGDYQLAQRRFLVVGEAENPVACQQEKIRAYLRRHGPSTFREIKRGTNAARVGTEIHKRAMTGLAEGDEIVSKPTERKNSFRYHLAKDE